AGVRLLARVLARQRHLPSTRHARCVFFFSSRRRHTISVSAFLLNRSSDLTIDVLPRTPGNNVYVGFMVWSNFTATKCRGLVSLNQVIKEIICLQPLK